MDYLFNVILVLLILGSLTCIEIMVAEMRFCNQGGYDVRFAAVRPGACRWIGSWLYARWDYICERQYHNHTLGDIFVHECGFRVWGYTWVWKYNEIIPWRVAA